MPGSSSPRATSAWCRPARAARSSAARRRDRCRLRMPPLRALPRQPAPRAQGVGTHPPRERAYPPARGLVVSALLEAVAQAQLVGAIAEAAREKAQCRHVAVGDLALQLTDHVGVAAERHGVALPRALVARGRLHLLEVAREPLHGVAHLAEALRAVAVPGDGLDLAPGAAALRVDAVLELRGEVHALADALRLGLRCRGGGSGGRDGGRGGPALAASTGGESEGGGDRQCGEASSTNHRGAFSARPGRDLSYSLRRRPRWGPAARRRPPGARACTRARGSRGVRRCGTTAGPDRRA